MKAKKPNLNFNTKKLSTAAGRAKIRSAFNLMRINIEDLYPFLTQINNEEETNRLLHTKTESKVQLYILQGHDLASRDFGSDSDPYLMVKCGQF